MTNLHQFYQIPIIVPPVQPDDPTRGVPSDHRIPLALPVSSAYHTTREYKTATVRPLPESGIQEFNDWIMRCDWDQILNTSSPTEQVEHFESTLENKLNIIFPLKVIRTSSSDKPFITAELKKLDRKKKKEYRLRGKSEKYKMIKKEFDLKYKKAAKKYIEKNCSALKKKKPGKAFATLKKMGAQPGDCGDEGSFSLQNHVDANMTDEECTEAIVTHFCSISQEYPLLDSSSLPPDVQNKLKQAVNPADIPQLTVEDVLQKMKQSKKPKSAVPGDIPKTLLNECSPELSIPVCKIFRNVLKTFEWPKQWRVEYGVPLQKVSNQENEDQLRIISLT